MARKSRRSSVQAGELNLTAMIDVAFQMLAFFIITTKPMDVLANLSVSRPEPSVKKAPSQNSTSFSIKIATDGSYSLNSQPYDKAQLESTLLQIGESDKTANVVIVCAGNSTHAKLCEVLDLCAKAQLSNISLLSE